MIHKAVLAILEVLFRARIEALSGLVPDGWVPDGYLQKYSWLCVISVFVPLHPMTSQPTSPFQFPAFTAGPGPNEPHTFLEETEVTLHRLHRNMQQSLGELPSPASDLPEGVGEGQSEPNNLFFLLTLLAIIAGAFLVMFTGF